jgi:hypothetical protein
MIEIIKNEISFFLQHSVESVESLTHAIDRNQLTPDLNGTFQYNHIRWLDFRLVIKETSEKCFSMN